MSLKGSRCRLAPAAESERGTNQTRGSGVGSRRRLPRSTARQRSDAPGSWAAAHTWCHGDGAQRIAVERNIDALLVPLLARLALLVRHRIGGPAPLRRILHVHGHVVLGLVPRHKDEPPLAMPARAVDAHVFVPRVRLPPAAHPNRQRLVDAELRLPLNLALESCGLPEEVRAVVLVLRHVFPLPVDVLGVAVLVLAVGKRAALRASHLYAHVPVRCVLLDRARIELGRGAAWPRQPHGFVHVGPASKYN